MKLQLESNQTYSFHNLNRTKKYTVKKSKCRHYSISIFDTVTHTKTAFKRISLKAVQNLIDLLIQARNQNKAKQKAILKQSKKPVLSGLVKKLVQCTSLISKSFERAYTGIINDSRVMYNRFKITKLI